MEIWLVDWTYCATRLQITSYFISWMPRHKRVLDKRVLDLWWLTKQVFDVFILLFAKKALFQDTNMWSSLWSFFKLVTLPLDILLSTLKLFKEISFLLFIVVIGGIKHLLFLAHKLCDHGGIRMCSTTSNSIPWHYSLCMPRSHIAFWTAYASHISLKWLMVKEHGIGSNNEKDSAMMV